MVSAIEMVALLEQALSSNAAVKQITVDGQTLVFDRQQALSEYEFWKRRAAVESGKRSLLRGVDLGSAW